jgi:hypothetical protein
MNRNSIVLTPAELGDPSPAFTTERFNGKRENYRMSEYRSVPQHRRAWQVTTTVLEAPKWVLEVFTVPGLPRDSQSFWIRHRRHAQRIVKLDRDLGGDGQLECVQYRLCRICKRVLVGAQAHEYTERIRALRSQWEFAAGPSCGIECVPKDKAVGAQRKQRNDNLKNGDPR